MAKVALVILLAASPAFCLWEQNDKTTGETNFKEVNGFSGYLTLADDPREKLQRWLDPREIVTLMAMPTMKRSKTMGAFVELLGCKQNAQGVCSVQVNYTIYKPDGSILAKRSVWKREVLWKKQASPTPRRSKPRYSSKRQGRKGVDIAFNHSNGLARMHFKLGKDDPVGEYKVNAKVSDLNADISFEVELNFYLR